MTEPVDTDPTVDRAPPNRIADAAQLTLGELLAALGFGLAVVSTALAWASQPFVEVGGGVYPSTIPMPNLLSAESSGQLPNAGLVVIALSVPGLFLCFLRSDQAWALVLRRVLAALLLAVVVLFAIRWNSFFEGVEDASFLRSLRAGFYLAALGSVLALVAGRWRPVRSEPRRLGVLPEDGA